MAKLSYRTRYAAPVIESALRDGVAIVTCDGNETASEVVSVGAREVVLRFGGRVIKAAYVVNAGHVYVGINGATVEFIPADQDEDTVVRVGEFTPKLTAPMPGKILEIKAAPGDTLAAGETVILLEAMKMETALRVQIDSRVVELRVAVGDTVGRGQVLAVLEPA